ncbi:DUF6356 family protein [Pontixanthobacter luteolus]|uniref:DUF6356 family protein n=1 Tax=Pontixanthobacter luteolus TaxID=295089 RepID=UPI002304A682|nr:DUF6356 family protein [Pontixanthobacter luteolus]
MNIFTDHPRSVGESYGEHFVAATSFGLPMITAGLACVLHGFFPFLFEKTGSNLVRKLYDRMVLNRKKMVQETSAGQQMDWCI